MGCGSSTSTSPNNIGSYGDDNIERTHRNKEDHSGFDISSPIQNIYHGQTEDGHGQRGRHSPHDYRRDSDIGMLNDSENKKENNTIENNTEEIKYDNYHSHDRDYDNVLIDPPEKEHESYRTNSEKYKSVGLGIMELYLDFRENGENFEQEQRPYVAPGDMYTDREFPLHRAIEEYSEAGVEWKRPWEFCEHPVLFSEGTTRFDIGQGSAGTCWFLSMLANVSENAELLKRIIPDDSWRFGQDEYDGIFHCRFWHFGEWHDVYTDDYLPVVYGKRLWGAKSATDETEMWVALVEKDFARMHGSYNAVYGGQSSDAYLALTGGVAEKIDFEDSEVVPAELFSRVRNSLQTGAMVSCTVPNEYDGVKGLVGGHAYSLNGAALVTNFDGGQVYLVRVRNPWGHTEWTGAWSDGSSEWNSIPEGLVENPNIDNGEFWMSLSDFLKYFSQTTICSLTPDFDSDGCSDSLNHVMCIYGDWVGKRAAGFPNKLENTSYVFTVPDEGMTEEGFVPLVVQIVQKTKHRKTDKFSIRCDLYKVLGQCEHLKPMYVLEILGTKTNLYSPEVQCTYRHRVEPGDYIVVPSTVNPGEEKEYLIRLFSPCPLLDCREVDRSSILMSCDAENSLEYEGQTYALSNHKTFFGAWVPRLNAGGQVSNRDTYHYNPQYAFTVPNRGSQPISFHLMQEQCEPKFPVGIRVYPLTEPAPVDIKYLYDHYEACPQNTEGNQSKFVITWDLDCCYVLPPGDYVALVHMDEPDTAKKFGLLVKSAANLSMIGYQTGI